MNDSDIHELVSRYRASRSSYDLEKAHKALAVVLYQAPHRFGVISRDEDRVRDFFSWFYPYIERIVLRFDPDRANILQYFRSITRLAFRGFLRRQLSDGAGEEAVFAQIQYDYTNEPAESQEYPAHCAETEQFYGDYHLMPLEKKRLFLLACKNAPFLTDTLVNTISLRTGIRFNRLWDLIDRLNQAGAHKITKSRMYAELATSYYTRSLRCKAELAKVEPQTARFERLAQEYRYCLERWKGIRMKASRQLLMPSNRLISRITGIPRGTIDSALAVMLRGRYPYTHGIVSGNWKRTQTPGIGGYSQSPNNSNSAGRQSCILS